MSFYEISEKILNEAFTENGDKAYKSTGSFCLDYFSLIGGMRYNLKDALNLFMKAYFENPILALKIMFYVRDIKSGLGERDLFRYTFNSLANMYPNVGSQLIKYIPEFGRFDDLIVLIESPLKNDVIKFFKEQLEIDLVNKKEGKPISLLAKWLPSINTSSLESKKYAAIIASALGMKKCEYRKMLSYLRNGLIVENNLRIKDYSFDYEVLPGVASFKYKNAFLRNDKMRYLKYIEDLNLGHAKSNTNILYPYEIIRRLEKRAGEEECKVLDAMWNSFDRNVIDSKTIVVRDGSGSMYDNCSVSANCVATSLAILFAEQLNGSFKNKFITFSSTPKLINIKGDTIAEKFLHVIKYNDVSNTNIQKVYELILKVYKDESFTKEDAIDRIVIISDMEFDCMGNTKLSTFEHFERSFARLGYKLPEIVFWNVRARSTHVPVMNQERVKLVSGSSAKIIDMIIKNDSFDAYQFMLNSLEKYAFIDKLEI